MAATYVEHEQLHQRPGLSWTLIGGITLLPILLVILAWLFSFKGANV